MKQFDSGDSSCGYPSGYSTDGMRARLKVELAGKEWHDMPVLQHYLKTSDVDPAFVARCRHHLENHTDVQTELQALRSYLAEGAKENGAEKRVPKKKLKMYPSLVRRIVLIPLISFMRLERPVF